MANYRNPKETEEMHRSILLSATRLFLTKGYEASTVKEIAASAGVSTSNLMYLMKSKEEILCVLVEYVLEGQFRRTEELLQGVTDDPILFYAAETTLQLHMAESSEQVRSLYSAAYSLPKSSDIIQHSITGKLEKIFRTHLPELETKDFYELEIASGGIMRSFMTVPCDMYFTMERKVRRFLETTFLVYRVPDEKIREAIEFVSRFDYPTLAKQVISGMLEGLGMVS